MKLAANYRRQIVRDGMSARKAAVLRNIAKTLVALANQYEI